MPSHPIQPIHLTVDGLDNHALSAGSGERCLLALHGGGSDSASFSWGDLVEPLAASGLRVIAPDLPGYGESARPDVNYTTAHYLGFIEHLVAALGITRFSLMGLSMGRALALGTALRRIVGSQLRVIDGAGYWVQREQPEAFRQAVVHFLNS